MDFVRKQPENVLTKYVLGARVDSELGILQIFIFLPRILQSPASAIYLPPFAQGGKTRPGVTASDMKKQNRDERWSQQLCRWLQRQQVLPSSPALRTKEVQLALCLGILNL